jgi:2,4-dienoyl-CoA reductase-like NADH-dependent reductase (Old Yellow Enzyme family)
MMMQPKSKKPDREFTQLYSMAPAKQIRAAVDMPLCYLGGAQTMDNVNTIMREGFDALALGRALIFDPNMINALQSGSVRNSGCTACNQCVTLMYTPEGTRCVLPGGHQGHAANLNTVPASAP